MRRVLLVIVAFVAVGCSLKLREAQVDIPSSYIYDRHFYQGDHPIAHRWWDSFQDSMLNILVDRALEHNKDLVAAAANVEAARHYLSVARAEFLPILDFDATAELTHEERVTGQEYTLAPALKWEVSLFGALRNTKRSAVAAFLGEEWNFRGVILSLTAEVATSYFTMLQYQRSLYMATLSYNLRMEATALVDSMYLHGMTNGTDLMQAKSLVYAAKVEMEQYKRAVALISLSLSTLVGEPPHEVDWGNSGRALLCDELPFEIPIGMPSSLLERRPDIMKSYYQMSQAAAEVGISRAARYPSIALTGSGGIFSTSLKGLTSENPLLWSAMGDIVAPIFSWGALRRREVIAREKYEVSVASYEQSVLEAFADVEKVLISIDTYSAESAASAALVLANTKIVENTSALYRSGLGDYLSVIDAERELYASQISLVEVVAQQYINYVNLFKALGGGW